jgi:hypothetical protein
MKKLLLSTPLAVAALAAGCGGSGGDPDADPAAVVPARAPVYIEATINPEGETADEIKALSQKLAGTDQPGAEIKRLLEKESKENGTPLNWDEDIEPWIGDRLGLYVSKVTAGGEDPDVALIAPAEDTDQAKEYLEKDLASKGEDDEQAPKVSNRTYKDVDYKLDSANNEAVAIVGDYAVYGTDEATKGVIDAQEGESLADADAFKKARDQVESEGVAFVYAKPSTLFSGLGAQGAALRQAFAQAGDTIAMAVDTEKDAIRIESAALGAKQAGSGDPGKLIAELPGDAWLAGGTADIGGQLEQSLEQLGQLGGMAGADPEQALQQIEQQFGIDLREDVISWMGDGGIFVQGETLGEIGGALVVQSSDERKTQSFITKLDRLVTQFGLSARPLRESGVDEGITLSGGQIPLPVHIASAGDRFIVAVTDQALESALEPEGRLGDSPAFKAAGSKLGDGIAPSFFVDMGPVRSLVDASGAVQGAEAERARKVLERLTTIAAGGKRDGDVQRGRFIVGVK